MKKITSPAPIIVPMTPQILGVTPRFVLLHNSLARSASTLSAPALKLAAMALALIPNDLSSHIAAFTFTEYCKALGVPKGGETYKTFLKSVDECLGCVITIELAPKKWKKFTWFSVAEFNGETGQATLGLSEELVKTLKELSREYTKLDLRTLGRIQSRYAIVLYAYLMSFAYLKGKQGNAPGTWYRDLPIPDIRLISGAPEGAYPEVRRLLEKTVHRPVDSLKDDAGLEVEAQSVKQGREAVAVRFTCKLIPPTLPVKRGPGRPKKVPAVPAGADEAGAAPVKRGRGRPRKAAPTEPVLLPAPSPKDERTREDKELAHLGELYPSEFAALYQEALADFDELLKEKPGLFPEDWKRLAAKNRALLELQKRHGIVK